MFLNLLKDGLFTLSSLSNVKMKMTDIQSLPN